MTNDEKIEYLEDFFSLYDSSFDKLSDFFDDLTKREIVAQKIKENDTEKLPKRYIEYHPPIPDEIALPPEKMVVMLGSLEHLTRISYGQNLQAEVVQRLFSHVTQESIKQYFLSNSFAQSQIGWKIQYELYHMLENRKEMVKNLNEDQKTSLSAIDFSLLTDEEAKKRFFSIMDSEQIDDNKCYSILNGISHTATLYEKNKGPLELFWIQMGENTTYLPKPMDFKPDEVLKLLHMVRSRNFNDYDERKSFLDLAKSFVSPESLKEFFKSKEFEEYYTHEQYAYEILQDWLPTEEDFMMDYSPQQKLYVEAVQNEVDYQKNLAYYLTDVMNPYLDSEKYQKLDVYCKLKGISFDVNLLKGKKNEELIDILELKEAINQYYQDCSQKERKSFVSECDIHHVESRDSGKAGVGFYLFQMIEDEEKYQYSSDKMLEYLMYKNMLPSEQLRLEALMKVKERSVDNAIYYLELIQEGTYPSLNLSEEQFEALYEQIKDDPDDKWVYGLLNAIENTQERAYEHLQQKPEDCRIWMNLLSTPKTCELLDQIEDESYKAYLMLNLEVAIGNSCLQSFYPYIEDDYVRAQLSIRYDGSYTEYGRRKEFFSNNNLYQGIEDSMGKIENYFRIKEQFLALPEEERVDFLCSIGEEADLSTNQHKDDNEIKKSLVSFIPDHEGRMEVIRSLKNDVSDDLKELAVLTETMIREFFEDNVELTEEQEEKLEIALREHDIYYTMFDSSGTRAKCRYVSKNVEMGYQNKGNLLAQIMDMLHERGHAESQAYFLVNLHHTGHNWEEGMADTFSELVANYYFSKHPNVTIGGEEYTFELPLVSPSSYDEENGLVKSALYPLQASGDDIKAVTAYALGDKNEFFRLVLGEDRCDELSRDYEGRPYGPKRVTDGDLIEINEGAYIDALESQSIYLIKNKRIRTLAQRDAELKQYYLQQEQQDEPSEEFSEAAERHARYRPCSGCYRSISKRYEL